MKIRAILSLLVAVTPPPALAGGIDKFDRRDPDVSYISPAGMFDIERCLIRLDGVSGIPYVYSQPDRPDERLLMWSNDNGDGAGRVDLKRTEQGTKITVWRVWHRNTSGVEGCAPRAK